MSKVVCVADYYLPGFKAGGPVRSIANICSILSGEIDIAVVTRDRDVGDKSPYPGVQSDDWHSVEGVPVYYAAPESFGAEAVEQALDGDAVLYLNSFFSARASIPIYWKYRKRGKILIAPRGEFSKGALSIKSGKKRAYLALAKALGLYNNVHWHASSVREKEDIVRVFPRATDRIHVAANPVALSEAVYNASPKAPGELRIGFISRVSPMKNLDGLLNMLAGVEQTIDLSIYGPTENAPYWEECQALIKTLPPNIRVEYRGHLPADKVCATFAEHDLFAFPTRGENFGHVIFEALAAGTPVLVSDQTPWGTHPSGAITAIPLESPDEWRAQIAAAANKSAEEHKALRTATAAYAKDYAASSPTRADNINMFLQIGARSKMEKINAAA